MGIPKYKAKRDAAEPEVVSALMQAGFSVYRMNTPVDLLVGFRGLNYLIEVKSDDKGYGKMLNENQRDFASGWRGGKVTILRSAQDAIDFAVMIASGGK